MSTMKKIFRKQNLLLFLGFLGFYLLSSGISFAVFNLLAKAKEPSSLPTPLTEEMEKGGFLVDVSGPETEVCPLTGEKYTKAEKEVWDKRRPLLVMVENHEDVRPQSGLSRADVVYEAIAEGGITRFLTVYYCAAQAKEVIIGPVRSARTYFLDWASEYGKYPLYAHVGGANTPGPADALGQIQEYGWGGSKGNDLNQFSIDYPTFWRDYERLGRTVATEHTMYSTTERLWGVAKSRGWTNKSPEGQEWQEDFEAWKFAEPTNGKTQAIQKIEFGFWEKWSAYKVVWQYEANENQYLRFNGGQPHKDLNYDQQLSAKNVVIQFLKETSANDGYENNVHLLYGAIGEGKAIVFTNGQEIPGKWVKKSRTGRTKFFDENGKEIRFLPGKIWIEILPVGNKITY